MKQQAAQQLEWMILGAAIANSKILRHVAPEQFGVPKASSVIAALKGGGDSVEESNEFLSDFSGELLESEHLLAAVARLWDGLCLDRGRDKAIEKIERSLHAMRMARSILTDDQMKAEIAKLADQIKVSCKEK